MRSAVSKFNVANLTHAAQVPRRVIVQEIMLGPVHCGTLTLEPGTVRPVTKATPSYPHPFVDLQLVHAPTQTRIQSLLDLSADGFDFQHRLLSEGFDFSCANPSFEKKPIGRCWRLISPSKELLGALWDSPGRLGTLTSGLSVSECHPEATLTLYFSPTDPLHTKLTQLFKHQCRSLSDLRREIESLGISLIPQLYELFN
ncbi:MAG: hypothetical protein EZS28_011611 [Streblomastix strix]|uniref:Uncharacterized protein n=1 Tax=Streblomastix strix TaxID=222440 RepID=A0A5J4WD15_9EUKA|nr:MAG: hypothetical protein EZS28_011611 [Streblomastix strix]